MSIMMLPMEQKIQWVPTSLQDIPAVLGAEAYTEEDKPMVSHAQKSQHSCLSHSRWLRSPQVTRGSWDLRIRPSKDSSSFCQVNPAASQNRPSMGWDCSVFPE
ncbi:LOW QUALITY PROTEIN: GPR142 isoform 1, partial [Pongo abelii]